jgi:hypothetical protein
MPAATTDWLVGSFRQPKAALLTTIGPPSTGPRRDPRDPECFAAARASRLQLPTDLPHQVSYGQHVTPQISWPPLTSAQRDRLASLGRRDRFRIEEATVWHRELRFDHLPDQLVFIVQELHHFRRGWAGLISRRFPHAHPLAAQEQQAPNTGQHYGGQQPSYYGPVPRHCHSSAVSNDRLKFKRLFKTRASRKQGVFVDFKFLCSRHWHFRGWSAKRLRKLAGLGHQPTGQRHQNRRSYNDLGGCYEVSSAS